MKPRTLTVGEVLQNLGDRYEARMNRLKRIKAIIEQHPDWLQEEPELAELLVFLDNSDRPK